jgi:hypothetical protein
VCEKSYVITVRIFCSKQFVRGGALGPASVVEKYSSPTENNELINLETLAFVEQSNYCQWHEKFLSKNFLSTTQVFSFQFFCPRHEDFLSTFLSTAQGIFHFFLSRFEFSPICLLYITPLTPVCSL